MLAVIRIRMMSEFCKNDYMICEELRWINVSRYCLFSHEDVPANVYGTSIGMKTFQAFADAPSMAKYRSITPVIQNLLLRISPIWNVCFWNIVSRFETVECNSSWRILNIRQFLGMPQIGRLAKYLAILITQPVLYLPWTVAEGMLRLTRHQSIFKSLVGLL